MSNTGFRGIGVEAGAEYAVSIYARTVGSGPQYVERYQRFGAALKAKHPEIQLVASAGPAPAGPLFEFLWGKMRELKADLVDEHYYMPPAW